MERGRDPIIKVKVKVNNKKVDNIKNDEDMNNTVDKISTLTESPRDKDGKI